MWEAYCENRRKKERVVKTQGYKIPPKNHKGPIRPQTSAEVPTTNNQASSLSSLSPPSLAIPPLQQPLKKCGISHAEVFRIIAGISSFHVVSFQCRRARRRCSPPFDSEALKMQRQRDVRAAYLPPDAANHVVEWQSEPSWYPPPSAPFFFLISFEITFVLPPFFFLEFCFCVQAFPYSCLRCLLLWTLSRLSTCEHPPPPTSAAYVQLVLSLSRWWKQGHISRTHTQSGVPNTERKAETELTLLHPGAWWQNNYLCEHDSPPLSLSSFSHRSSAADCRYSRYCRKKEKRKRKLLQFTGINRSFFVTFFSWCQWNRRTVYTN